MKHTQRHAAVWLGGTHFLVDFVCGLFLTMAVSKQGHSAFEVVVLMLIYNGLAFAFQFPIGALADRLHFKRQLTALGCVLVSVGIAIPHMLLLGALIGIGNACFHIGGGRETLLRGGTLAGAIGHFVAPGALGIFAGPKLASLLPSHTMYILGYGAAAVLLINGILFAFSARYKSEPDPVVPSLHIPRANAIGAVLCLALTVFLRSYLSTFGSYPFQKQLLPAMLLVLCVGGGKFIGGDIADRFGTVRGMLITQVLGTALLLLSARWDYAAFAAYFLFNTTMAVTAHTLYRIAPSYSGTMFGVTTFAIFLGVLPAIFDWDTPLSPALGFLLFGAASTVLLITGLLLTKEAPCDGR